METIELLKQMKTGIQSGAKCTFAKFDAASVLAARGEWALLRWCYATNIAMKDCAYFLRRSSYRGEWDTYQNSKRGDGAQSQNSLRARRSIRAGG